MHMIPNSILKISKDIISHSLSDIFNESLCQQFFPDDFNVARVTPTYKGGERDDLAREKTDVFHSVLKVWMKWGNTMENCGSRVPQFFPFPRYGTQDECGISVVIVWN